MDNLEAGIAAFKAGKRDEARSLLIAAMKDAPNNENVWGWLYQVSNNDIERIQALRKVVAINPQNVKAKELLDKLLAPPQFEPVRNKKKNNILIFSVVFVSLCVMCAVAALGIKASEKTNANTNTVDQYMQEYGGNPDVYTEIIALTDCAMLQIKFDTAADNLHAPGTQQYHWSQGYMAASDARMKDIGCYK